MLHTPSALNKLRPLRKLFFSVFRRYAEIFLHRYSVQRRMGVLMLLDKQDKVDLNLLCGGYWETDRIDYLMNLVRLKRHLAARTVFLDIGAHGALYSLVLDKHLHFDRIVAFEPEPVGLAQIRANAMMNGIGSKFEVVAKAVSAEVGVAKFLLSHESNRGQSHLAPNQGSQTEQIMDVEVTSIDELFADQGTLLVAKIDVEGHEDDVVRGMKVAISNNHVILQVEINDGNDLRAADFAQTHKLTLIHSIGQDYYFANC